MAFYHQLRSSYTGLIFRIIEVDIEMNNYNKKFLLGKKKLLLATTLSTLFALSGCNTEGVAEGLEPLPDGPVDPSTLWWNVPAPDLTTDAEKPEIILNGELVSLLNVGEDYVEQGALGQDVKDGDITSNIVIAHDIDVTQSGDYIVRYQLTDSDGNNAVEINRIVRVYDENPTAISKRVFGTTQSSFGYVEHLPHNYGIDADKKYPMIIYHHGNGANAERTSEDPVIALDAVINNGGPITLMNEGNWDNDLPFIVLSPHFGTISPANDLLRIDNFVEYAKHTYQADTSRIYMVGWSQGGLISYDYAVNFPEKMAAIVSVSGGYPYGATSIPNDLCDAENTPMWLFHGNNDDVVAHATSIGGQSRIVDNCQPTQIPKLTVVDGADHELQHSIFDLSGLVGGSQNYTYDVRYEEYDESIYQWLLSQQLPEE